MDSEGQDTAKVQVKFKTHLAKYKVTEKPFQVPVNLNRRGLSQVINHLLGNSSNPVPFDFLIENEFLRNTLEKYMTEHNRSFEEVVTIEYVELLDAPTPSEASTHSDWIAAIDNRLLELRTSLKASKAHYDIVPYGAYDAQVCCLDQRLLKSQPDDSTWLIGTHTQPVLSVSSYFRGGHHFDLATSSQDSSVSVWNIDIATQKVAQTHSLQGHDGAVEHVEFDPTGKLIATASWDGDVKIWDLTDGTPAEEEGDRKTKKSKSKETSSKVATSSSAPGSVSQVEARSTLTGHMQCVSTLQWMDADQLVSGSWDHSLRFWDVESGVCTSHLDGNKVILSLDYSTVNSLIATGHADKTVRTWDPRVSIASSSLCTSYTSHTGWVSAVMWHPTDANILVSGSFDSHIKVWDIRSSTPLHTLPSQHKDKVTTLAWLDNETFVSGGADKYIRTYSFPRGSTSQ